MRDLHLARMINVVATGTLMVSAVGCGGKKEKSAPKTPNKDEAIAGLCELQQRCDAAGFDSEYASLEDCIAQGEVDYASYEEEYGADCVESFLEFTGCYLEALSNTCDEDVVYEECTTEAVRAYVDCDLGSY